MWSLGLLNKLLFPIGFPRLLLSFFSAQIKNSSQKEEEKESKEFPIQHFISCLRRDFRLEARRDFDALLRGPSTN